MTDDEFFKERRVLPADYPAKANKRTRKKLGFTDADFEAMRRPYDESAPHALQARPIGDHPAGL